MCYDYCYYHFVGDKQPYQTQNSFLNIETAYRKLPSGYILSGSGEEKDKLRGVSIGTLYNHRMKELKITLS